MTQRYSAPAIALHWLTALLIAANLLLGLSMVPLPLSPRKLQWYFVHKSVGITIFAITCARLAWRAYRAPPPPVAAPAWQLRTAAATHWLLYALLVLIPLSGWVYSSATGVQVVYVGLFPLPDLVPRDKALAAALKNVHVGLNVALAIAVCGHVAAALKHHLVDRDAVLARMLPFVKHKDSAT